MHVDVVLGCIVLTSNVWTVALSKSAKLCERKTIVEREYFRAVIFQPSQMTIWLKPQMRRQKARSPAVSMNRVRCVRKMWTMERGQCAIKQDIISGNAQKSKKYDAENFCYDACDRQNNAFLRVLSLLRKVYFKSMRESCNRK